MSKNLLFACGLFVCAVAGCRGPQSCSEPVIVSSSPIATPAYLPPASGCSSCGAGAAAPVVAPYGPSPAVGVSYGPMQ